MAEFDGTLLGVPVHVTATLSSQHHVAYDIASTEESDLVPLVTHPSCWPAAPALVRDAAAKAKLPSFNVNQTHGEVRVSYCYCAVLYHTVRRTAPWLDVNQTRGKYRVRCIARWHGCVAPRWPYTRTGTVPFKAIQCKPCYSACSYLHTAL